MSHDPIQDIRHDLVRAAHRRSRRRWRRPVGLAIGAALVIAAPATAAITGLWSPDVQSTAPMATTTATASAPRPSRCGPSAPGTTTRQTTTQKPPPALLRHFEIFRTPQTAGDRAGLDRFDGGRVPGLVATTLVRRLPDDAAGQARWIVPSLLEAGDGASRCANSGWVLTTIGAGGGTTDMEYVATHGSLGAAGTPDNAALATVTGLVPDAVTSVTVHYPGDGGAPRTWPVSRNSFSYRVRLSVDRAAEAQVSWNASDESKIRHR